MPAPRARGYKSVANRNRTPGQTRLKMIIDLDIAPLLFFKFSRAASEGLFPCPIAFTQPGQRQSHKMRTIHRAGARGRPEASLLPQNSFRHGISTPTTLPFSRDDSATGCARQNSNRTPSFLMKSYSWGIRGSFHSRCVDRASLQFSGAAAFLRSWRNRSPCSPPR